MTERLISETKSVVQKKKKTNETVAARAELLQACITR
jgi:hypothetical protein